MSEPYVITAGDYGLGRQPAKATADQFMQRHGLDPNDVMQIRWFDDGGRAEVDLLVRDDAGKLIIMDDALLVRTRMFVNGKEIR